MFAQRLSGIDTYSITKSTFANMDSTSQAVTSEFTRAISGELSQAAAKIRHCVNQLSSDQLWWRPDDSMNGVANLILHLCGNVDQWIVAGLGGKPDRRDRPKEFAQRGGLSAAELIRRLDQTESEARRTIGRVTSEELVRRRTIQGFEVTVLQAIVESVSHFRGHTQEIVHLTRLQLGEKYQFDFVPGPDQHGGAANEGNA